MVVENLDQFIEQKVVPFREKVLEEVARQHPHILTVVNAILSGRKNAVGMIVTQNGESIGKYTFYLDGVKVERVGKGELAPEIHHPFLGIVKPYGLLECSTLETMLADDRLLKEPFSALAGYLPDITIKFMR